MTIEKYIEYNFTPVIGLIFQFIILFFGSNFTKKEKSIFILTFVLEILELVSYNAEIALSYLDKPTSWRILLSVIGYITRPALVYPFVVLLRQNTNSKLSKLKYWDLIPLAIVIIVQQFAFGTKWVFYYTEQNNFVRGPLGFVSQAITVLYMVETSIEILLTKINNRKINVGLIIVVMLYVVLAMVIESIFDIKSLGISSAIISIVYFMFALQTNHLNTISNKLKTISETDSLSQLSNRYSGEKQIDELLSQNIIGTFAIIDVDKFKQINDTYGHAIGDETIIKIAKALKASMKEDDIIMRLGGDEFAIFSSHSTSHEEIEKDINNLFEEINNIRLSSDSKYRVSISVGISQNNSNDNNNSFDKLYRAADSKLYEAKKTVGNYVCY